MVLGGPVLATTEVIGSAIDGSSRAGVANFAASVTLGNVWLDCNTIDINGEPLDAVPFVYEQVGHNQCGCGVDATVCRVLSAGLDPPLQAQ